MKLNTIVTFEILFKKHKPNGKTWGILYDLVYMTQNVILTETASFSNWT